MRERIGMAVELAKRDGKALGPPIARPDNQQVIGIVCTGIAAKLRESESDILRMVGKVVEKYPDAIFVCCEKRSDKLAGEVLEFWDVDPVVLPTNPYWKVGTSDNRKPWRDSELKRWCDKVMVFVPRGGSSDWRTFVEKDAAMREKYPSWGPQTVFLIEYGEAPPPKPKVRRAKKRAKAFA